MRFAEQLLGWLGVRRDAAPALPGPVEVVERRRDSVINPLTGLGGLTDKGAVARPNPCVIPLSDMELRTSYANSGICRRIVDLLPDEATRRGWSAPDIDPEEDERLNTYEQVCDAAKMARLYGGSIVLLVTEDDIPAAFRRDPRRWLEQPLDLRRVGALLSLPVFDSFEARPAEYETNIASPGYRLPRLWSIGANGISARVHASRVLYFRGAKRPPSETQGGWFRSGTMPDDSVIQAVWDEIRRLSETMAGGAVLAQELRESVLKVGELPSQQTGDDAGAFQSRLSLMAQMKSMLGLILLGPNDDYQNRANPPTGFDQLSEAAQAMLATVLGWPRSMLSGEPPGGMSTDDKSGLERERKIVSNYQEQRLRRVLTRLYTVAYSAQDGPTGGQVPEGWSVAFAPLNEPTDIEVAGLRKTVMETDVGYITAGVLPPDAVCEGRFGPEGWQLDLPEVEPPDPDEEAAVEAARLALEAEADPEERGDASPVLPSDAPPELRAAVRKLIAEWPAREEP